MTLPTREMRHHGQRTPIDEEISLEGIRRHIEIPLTKKKITNANINNGNTGNINNISAKTSVLGAPNHLSPNSKRPTTSSGATLVSRRFNGERRRATAPLFARIVHCPSRRRFNWRNNNKWPTTPAALSSVVKGGNSPLADREGFNSRNHSLNRPRNSTQKWEDTTIGKPEKKTRGSSPLDEESVSEEGFLTIDSSSWLFSNTQTNSAARYFVACCYLIYRIHESFSLANHVSSFPSKFRNSFLFFSFLFRISTILFSLTTIMNHPV